MPRSLVRCERGHGETLRDELVTQFQPELENSRIVSLGDDARVTAVEVLTVPVLRDARFPLRMVPGIEAFRPELQVDPLGEGEGLVDREVPVVAAGTGDAVVSKVAPGSGGRLRKAGDREPLNTLDVGGLGLRIGDWSYQVRPVLQAVGKDAGHVRPRYLHIQWWPAHHVDNP